ncbi:MAG: hypothetical protein ACI4VQ_04810 [Clostridia bacterium]
MNDTKNDGFGSFWWWLAVTANWCQIESYEMNKKQISNDVIMKHLEAQDYVLDEQTNVYLKQILENQKEIINLLKGDKNNAQKVC